MEKITIIGNLGADALVKESNGGRSYVKMSVAVNSKRNGEVKTSWYFVSLFNYSQNFIQYLTKGSKVIVGGDLDVSMRTDSNGVTRLERSIVADYIQFMPSSSAESGNTTNAKTTPVVDEEITTTTTRPSVNKTTKEKPAPIVESDDLDLPF